MRHLDQIKASARLADNKLLIFQLILAYGQLSKDRERSLVDVARLLIQAKKLWKL